MCIWVWSFIPLSLVMQGLVHTDFKFPRDVRGSVVGCASEADTRNISPPHQPSQEEQGRTSLEKLAAGM